MFDWIAGIVEGGGYAGIAFLMFLENVFPPIPSELIMPLGGYVAAGGTLSIVGVVLAGSAGSLLGALLWYWIGRAIGADRLKRWAGAHGRWLTLHPEEVQRAIDWFGRRGWLAVLVGRMVPTVRTLISVPAGIARMPLVPFLLYSALGTVLWTGLLAAAGYLLQSHFTRVEAWMEVVTNLIVAGIATFYAYRVITFRRSKAEGG